MKEETKKVYKAISLASQMLAKDGVGKNAKNQAQGFAYRGIDAVMNALASVLVDAKLIVLPRYRDRVVTERINAKGTALFYVTLTAEFDFVSVEDGSSHTVVAYGEAMDMGDKATNKAMSIAYKYAVLQAFCIPTEAQDPDAEVHEVQAEAKKITSKPVRYLFPTDHPRIDEVREFAKDHGFSCSTIGSVVNVIADKEIAPWSKFLVQGGANG